MVAVRLLQALRLEVAEAPRQRDKAVRRREVVKAEEEHKVAAEDAGA